MSFLRRLIGRTASVERDLTDEERTFLNLLLAHDFKGNPQLREQLRVARVNGSGKENDPTIGLLVDTGKAPAAPVRHEIPVEAVTTDRDGAVIHVLLHVVDGFIDELEFYRDDERPIMERPHASDLRDFFVPEKHMAGER